MCLCVETTHICLCLVDVTKIAFAREPPSAGALIGMLDTAARAVSRRKLLVCIYFSAIFSPAVWLLRGYYL